MRVGFRTAAARVRLLAFGLALAALPANAAGLDAIRRFVVIYEENHSFDNLYGDWEQVRGLGDAAHAPPQAAQGGTPYHCLLQTDVNLVSPPLPASCSDSTTASGFVSAFPNAPFTIDDFIRPRDRTCAPLGDHEKGVLKGAGAPGGCTRDLVHRFYQEQYQIHGGRQDRYVAGSDAAGFVMGHYATRRLPVYRYLHRPGHPRYAVADAVFQAAFGGSFLNHQWLVAAATPVFAGAVADGSTRDQHSMLDASGFPTAYPLYTPEPEGVEQRDRTLTVRCAPGLPAEAACGDFVINTAQPFYAPYAPRVADARRLPPLDNPTIGDRLNDAGIDWAWYAGGWSNASGARGAPGWSNGDGPQCADPGALPDSSYPNCPDALFQFHHQPFNYFRAFDPATAAGAANRAAHLRDEAEFLVQARSSRHACRLKPVSFVKPVGAENEHPGYASEAAGDDHLVELLKALAGSACARDTLVIVTYDEYGGQWDHRPPPGQGNDDGPHDRWGPGTRVPALLLSPHLRASFVVDRESHDTTSIVATIEHRFHLQPLGPRDAAVRDFATALAAPAAGTTHSPRPTDH
jgi:phospholipase C